MLTKKLILELQEYIDIHMEQFISYSQPLYDESVVYDHAIGNEIDNFVKRKRKPGFHEVLFDFIDQNGASDSDIYNKAGIDRRHFSKIRSNPDYRPKKNTILALALALELSKEDTDTILTSAGYSFANSETSDLVLQFCLEKKIYNIHDVNQVLNHFHLKPLSV